MNRIRLGKELRGNSSRKFRVLMVSCREDKKAFDRYKLTRDKILRLCSENEFFLNRLSNLVHLNIRTGVDEPLE